MVSNLEDLHTWVRALATGSLLSPEMQAERLRWTGSPQAPTASSSPTRIDFVHALATAGEKLRHAASERA